MILILGCEEKPENQTLQNNEIKVVLDNEPRNIHSKYWSSSQEKAISEHIFQKLLDLDPSSFEPIEVLAADIPIVEGTTEEPKIQFIIKDHATWHDGKPVTPEDVIFTVKFAFSPFLDQEIDGSFYRFIKDVKTDPSNPKAVIFHLDHLVPDPLFSTGSLPIIPRHVYDPEGLFDPYSVEDFWGFSEVIGADSALKKLSEKIMEEVYAWAPKTLIGSGPYKFKSRTEGMGLTLERVEDYWGGESGDSNPWFLAYPQNISYRVIAEPVQKKIALENQEVDLYRFSTAFLQSIKDNTQIEDFFHRDEIVYFGFVYLGLNKTSEIFESQNVRKAFSFLIDKKELVNFIAEGYGKINNHPFFGIKENSLPQIRPDQTFSLDSCIHYLEKENWVLSASTGIRMKNINGNPTKLSLRYVYSSNNKSSEDTGLLLKDKASRAGIEIRLIPLEFGTYVESMTNHDFDLTRGGIGILPRGFNYSALFHTDAIDNGKNYVGFGNEKSDELLEKMEVETNPEKVDQIRVLISNEIIDSKTWIILYNPEIPVLISKKYTDYINSPVFQGIWPPSIK